MQVLLFTIGLAIVALTMVDALATTISTGGAGPVTKLVSRSLWRVALAAHRRSGSHTLLAAQGPIIVITVLVVWVVLLWTGYTFMFSANPEQIVSSQTRLPADLGERVYYTGFTIFTLGVGDFVADSDFYRHLTAIGSLNGLFLVTLAITYMVPVLSAVVDKRQLACTIHGLGRSPEDIVRSAWDGTSCSSLSSVFEQLAPTLVKHTQRHLAYPVLHYFHSMHRRDAFPVQIAALSEALDLLDRHVAPEARPGGLSRQLVRCALDSYLEVLGLADTAEQRDHAPDPDLEPLRKAGVPVSASADAPDGDSEAARTRRAGMGRLLSSQGWTWKDVFAEHAR